MPANYCRAANKPLVACQCADINLKIKIANTVLLHTDWKEPADKLEKKWEHIAS